MKRIDKILEKASPNSPSVCAAKGTPASTPQGKGLAMQAERPSQGAMRQLWLRMVAIYGHKWATAQGAAAETDEGRATEAANTWARGLAGIGGEQLGAGLKACVAASDPWPPTLPQFRAMCLGVPSLAAVQLVLSDKARPMTPFVRLVWSYIDGYRFRTASADKAERLIRDAYDIAREHVMNGGALPTPVAGVIGQEQPVHVAASPEVAEKHIAEVRELYRRTSQAPADDEPEPPRAA